MSGGWRESQMEGIADGERVVNRGSGGWWE